MADQFSISVDTRQVVGRFRKLSIKVGDTRQPLEAFGEALLVSTDARWLKQIDPAGRAWKPLALSTIKRKQALGQPLSILRATDRLRSSMRYRVGNGSLQFGTNVGYGPRVAADRQFVGFSSEDIELGLRILMDHIKKP